MSKSKICELRKIIAVRRTDLGWKKVWVDVLGTPPTERREPDRYLPPPCVSTLLSNLPEPPPPRRLRMMGASARGGEKGPGVGSAKFEEGERMV